MTRTQLSLLAPAVLCAALLAGCGGASSTTSGSTPAASSASAPSKPAPSPTTKSSPASSSAAGAAAGVASYEAICKTIARSAPALSASEKAKVEGVCSKAAHGNLAGARAAAKEVCVEVIKASPVPAALKQQSLAHCAGI